MGMLCYNKTIQDRQRVPGALGLYVRFLTKGGSLIFFLFWTIVTVFGALNAGSFLDSLVDVSNDLSPSLPGIIADVSLATYFPLQFVAGYLMIVVKSQDVATTATEINGPVHKFVKAVEFELWNQSDAQSHQILRIESPFNTTTSFYQVAAQMQQLPDGAAGLNLSNIGCDLVKLALFTYPFCEFATEEPDKYLSADKETALVFIRVEDPWGHIDWFAELVDKVANRPEHEGVIAKSASEDQVNDVVTDGLEADLLMGDTISIPTAIIVMCYTLRSMRYIFVPLLSIICGVTSSILIMTPIANTLSTSSVAPNMIMVLTIALAVDYNLFLLSRWREECRNGKDFEQAIVNMLAHAGHTVVVSGLTLKACCWTMWLLPLDLLRSLGTASAVSVAMCMAVNLTLIPSLIATFPRYFTRATEDFKGCCKSKSKHANYDLIQAQSLGVKDNLSINPSSVMFTGGVDDDDDDEMLNFSNASLSFDSKQTDPDAWNKRKKNKTKQSPWYRFGKFLTRGYTPWISIAVITALCGVLIDPAVTFYRIGGMKCLAPVNLPITKVFNQLSRDFGEGRNSPYTLVVVDTGSTASGDDDNLVPDAMRLYNLGASVINETQTDDVQIKLTFDFDPVHDHASVAWLANFTAGTSAVIVEFALSVDPWGGPGTDWLLAARKHLDKVEETAGSPKYYIAGGAAVDIDIVVENYNAFPMVIGAVGALIIVFMAAAFRSLVLPLKAVISIALTLSLVYGTAKFVYENGVLDWIGFYGLSKSGGLCWIPPVLIFPMLIGFGLDYHIFLLSRVVEYRKMGHSEIESVVLGLSKSGRVITSAGLIMALAFAGQLPSHELILAQLSYIVIVSVLADTFIVRAILVPSMMAVIGKYNWWPRKMPNIKEDHSDIGMLDMTEISDLAFLDP